MNLGKNLRRLMKERHITIDGLAKQANVSASNIKTWLGGGEARRLEEVRRIAQVLKISFEELIFGDEKGGITESKNSVEIIGDVNFKNVFDGFVRLRVDKIENKTIIQLLKNLKTERDE